MPSCSAAQTRRSIAKLQPEVDEINRLEPEFERLGPTINFARRDRRTPYSAVFLGKDCLDDLLPEAFAAVREAAKRALGQRHYDVQLIGGIVLHQGKIAEMKTGEGKTLVATLPAYLNSLTDVGVHVVTVNDYLARRDAHWMGAVYDQAWRELSEPSRIRRLSFSTQTMTEGERGLRAHEACVKAREAYRADITYGTNNEFGFDYLA